MLEQFKSLDKREQQALLVGGISIICFIVIQFIFFPFFNHLHQLKKQIAYEQDLLTFMQQAQKEWKPQIKKNKLDPGQLISGVNNALKSHFTDAGYQLKQSESDHINLSFPSVPYVQLIEWMTNFWSQYQVTLVKFDLSPLPTQGLVKVTLSIQTT